MARLLQQPTDCHTYFPPCNATVPRVSCGALSPRVHGDQTASRGAILEESNARAWQRKGRGRAGVCVLTHEWLAVRLLNLEKQEDR